MTLEGCTVEHFATKLAREDHWLCVIYINGCSEDDTLGDLCRDIGNVEETGGLCIVANVEDAECMAALSHTVRAATTYNSPIYSMHLGRGNLPACAVRTDNHCRVVDAGGRTRDRYEFVREVLTRILKVLDDHRA
eukprot:jgi/Undpi1/6124/HiC_scaffold_20.g08609.m1